MLGGKARSRALAALVGALVFTIASPFPKASALTSDEGSLLSYTNADRTKYGKPKLTLSGDLVAVAREHSAEMAAKGAIYHNPNLGGEVHNWRKVGENVGRGPSAKKIHQAFMASSSHRVHILDGAYDRIGVGTVWKGDTLYVTVIFVDPPGGSKPAAKPVAKPAPAPAKKSVPAPAPVPVAAEPKPAPPPPVPKPVTIGLLLRLVALDTGIEAEPMPAPESPPIL